MCVSRTLTAQAVAPVVVLTSTDSTGFTDGALAACGARAFVPKERLPRVDLRSLLGAPGIGAPGIGAPGLSAGGT